MVELIILIVLAPFLLLGAQLIMVALGIVLGVTLDIVKVIFSFLVKTSQEALRTILH